MSMSASGKAGSVAEINVTPLIDVLLVLLIIFMVIVPVASNGMGATVPEPAEDPAHAVPDPKTIVVSVIAAADGTVSYTINQTPFAKADIERELASVFAGRQDKHMFVRGDKDLAIMMIADVIDDAHRAGVDRIGLITPRSEVVR